MSKRKKYYNQYKNFLNGIHQKGYFKSLNYKRPIYSLLVLLNLISYVYSREFLPKNYKQIENEKYWKIKKERKKVDLISNIKFFLSEVFRLISILLVVFHVIFITFFFKYDEYNWSFF